MTAVNDVSFSVKQGEILLIMGPSGSGKTTLLTMIGGLLTTTAGNIHINGTDITTVGKHALAEIRLRQIGFVFQSFNVLQNLTALENVQIVGDMAGMSQNEIQKRSRLLFEKLHMEQRATHLPAELSGGQQQRIAIARALMNEPGLILADEPTGNLDSKSGHEVMMLFHNIAKEDRRTVIIVSHDERIKDIADRTIWIEDGSIQAAPPEQEQMVQDPVCGMRIDPRYSPFRTSRNKISFVFCSEDCQKKFLAAHSQ